MEMKIAFYFKNEIKFRAITITYYISKLTQVL
jgi:hypothetical protein